MENMSLLNFLPKADTAAQVFWSGFQLWRAEAHSSATKTTQLFQWKPNYFKNCGGEHLHPHSQKLLAEPKSSQGNIS